MIWSPNGALLAAGYRDGTLLIFDTKTGETLADLIGHTYWITQMTWSQDGSNLFTTSRDGTFRTWGIP